jgi:hypothetical protein
MSQLGWLIGLVKHAIWADAVVAFNSFIAAYPMTFFIGMLGYFWLL